MKTLEEEAKDFVEEHYKYMADVSKIEGEEMTAEERALEYAETLLKNFGDVFNTYDPLNVKAAKDVFRAGVVKHFLAGRQSAIDDLRNSEPVIDGHTIYGEWMVKLADWLEEQKEK